MSSFFTVPASQKKKRKHKDSSNGVGRPKQTSRPRPRRDDGDENISSSDEDDEVFHTAPSRSGSEESDDDFEDEDPAAKRIRLAEQYLVNTQKAVLEDSTGFDAAEVDQENLRRRMGDRLKADTAESKGKIYKWIGNDYVWQDERIVKQTFKSDGKAVTGVAVDSTGELAYTCSLDGSIAKWDISSASTRADWDRSKGGRPPTIRPRKVAFTRSKHTGAKGRRANDTLHHTGRIVCIAVSSDGKFVVTGGTDNKLIVWDSAKLTHLKTFAQHRDTVTALAFRRGTNQLFSASRDRTVKVWSLDELAYVETLYGHQDEVVDISTLAQEKCISVGARDRTARLWKVVEESQLVFRGGGADRRVKRDHARGKPLDGSAEESAYHEGSTDRVAMLDDETFVTASDNGSLSLWSIHKKKAIFTVPVAHGLDPLLPAEVMSAEIELGLARKNQPKPRWITALKAIPFSNLFISGSWDGHVRAWRVSEDKKHIHALGPIQRTSIPDQMLESPEIDFHGELVSSRGADQDDIPGFINDLSIVEKGSRGGRGILVAAAVGKTHRLGRWQNLSKGWNGCALFEIPSSYVVKAGTEMTNQAVARNGDEQTFEPFT